MALSGWSFLQALFSGLFISETLLMAKFVNGIEDTFEVRNHVYGFGFLINWVADFS